jgi:hypothetical protein
VTPMSTIVRDEFERRLRAGYENLNAARHQEALAHFEAAHILGQSHTWRHVRSHLAILRWSVACADRRELFGQLGRLVGASLFTWWWVPLGNPGTTRVGAFTPHAVPPELALILSGSGTPKRQSHG